MATIREKGCPTRKTKGAVGDIYVNIITGKQYKCVNSYRVGDEGDYEWKRMDILEVVKETLNPTVEEADETIEAPVENEEEPVVEEAEEVTVDVEPVVEEQETKGRINYAALYNSKNN